MKSLFDPSGYCDVLQRIEHLRSYTKPVWGIMNSAQMLAHNTAAMEYACGDWHVKQIFLVKILGPFMKSSFYNEKPVPKHSPTSSKFIMSSEKEFELEKQRLLTIVKRFHEGGPAAATKSPHMFFGHMTPQQWGTGMYKHLDHHFMQFGN